jgi:hypothetical protein
VKIKHLKTLIFVQKVWNEEIIFKTINNMILSFRLRLDNIIFNQETLFRSIQKKIFFFNFKIKCSLKTLNSSHCISEMKRDDRPMNLQYLLNENLQQNRISQIMTKIFILKFEFIFAINDS